MKEHILGTNIFKFCVTNGENMLIILHNMIGRVFIHKIRVLNKISESDKKR